MPRRTVVTQSEKARAAQPPRLPAALLRALLPYAEREEVLADLAQEYAERLRDGGDMAARLWFWRQVFGSVPSLLRRSWWRGWSGFEPRANRMRPGGPTMESWIMDLRYAARRLRSRPTYTLLAVLTLALGIVGALALARVLTSFLYGVGAADPLALAGATAALLAVGLLASFVPAHRASRVDPATVLREQ